MALADSAHQHPSPQSTMRQSELDDVLVCCQVIRESADVLSFVFAAADDRRFDYRPGQFVTFAFDVAGETVYRCYTLSSSPTRPHRIAITVKQQPGGKVSSWLHATMKPGMRVRASDPMGEFSHELHPAPRYLFLSAGSGITPAISMTRSLHDHAADADIAFVHSARSPKDLLFRQELSLLARGMPHLRVSMLSSREADGEEWIGARGRLNLPLLRHLVPDLEQREIFSCGPALYMEAVNKMLDEAGIDPLRRHQESFRFEDEPGAQAVEVVPAAVAAAFRVDFSSSQCSIECPVEMPVLEAARRAGMRMPSSCKRGLCGTCKSRLLSGRVDMQHAGGIRQREIDAGMFLPCCSRPLSDLVVER